MFCKYDRSIIIFGTIIINIMYTRYIYKHLNNTETTHSNFDLHYEILKKIICFMIYREKDWFLFILRRNCLYRHSDYSINGLKNLST